MILKFVRALPEVENKTLNRRKLYVEIDSYARTGTLGPHYFLLFNFNKGCDFDTQLTLH